MQHSETLDLSVINIADSDVFSIKQSGNTKGYDGHCLRAYAYFGDQMPDICLATEKDRCFEVVVGGQKRVIKCGTLVTCPDGIIRKIEDFYDMETSS